MAGPWRVLHRGTSAPGASDAAVLYDIWIDLANGQLKMCTAVSPYTWTEIGGGTFLSLSDTPSSYSGQGGKTVTVKGDASGLEFTTPAGGGDMLKATYDTDADDIVDKAESVDDGAGNAKTAAQVKSHIDSTANPHSVTAAQVSAIADGADTVKDTHVDWGAGAGQVDADDVPESATKKWAGETGADVTGSNAPQAHKDSHDPADGGDPLDTAAASEIAGVQAAGAGSSHSLARADHAHQIQHGIADNHLVTVDQADAASGEYVRMTANGIESRSAAEAKSDLGFMTDLSDDTTPTLGGTLEVGAKGIQLKHDLADHTYSGVIVTGVYGDTLAFGDLIYLAVADGRWEKADADAEATAGDVLLGIALESGNDADSKLVLLYGTIRDDTWAITSNGDTVYVSTTAGGVTQTRPSGSGDIVRPIGHLTQTNNVIMFNPSGSWVEIA